MYNVVALFSEFTLFLSVHSWWPDKGSQGWFTPGSSVPSISGSVEGQSHFWLSLRIHMRICEGGSTLTRIKNIYRSLVV